MKKLLAIVLSCMLLMSLFTACGSKPAQSDGPFALSGDVEFVCPYSAGGGSDLYARTAANIISELKLTGNSVVSVVNKPGGGGSVGDAYTVTKNGNGNTITTYVSAQITGPMINSTSVTWKDLTPICNLAMDEYTLGVLANSEINTLDSFIAYAKANPGKLTIGGSGSGTEDNLVTGLMELYCDIDVEYIAFDSSSEVMTAMLGGHINAGIYNPNEAISQYEAGDVALIAAFGPERISVLPEVPTFTEQGFDKVVFQQFRGIFGAPNMSQEAVDYWVNIFKQVVEHESWTQGYLATNGLSPKFISGQEFLTFLEGEDAKYRDVLDTLGLLAK